MFAYHLKLALLSFRKTPVLSMLIVGAIGLGIGVCISILTVYSLMNEDPVPDYSAQLFTYKLNNQPALTGGRTAADPAPPMVGYVDAINLSRSTIPERHALHYQTGSVFYPTRAGDSAFTDQLRLANSGFFALHRVPFLYGSAWSEAEETAGPYLTVLTRDLNEKLFSGNDSTGRSVRIGPNSYTVVGVMDYFEPLPLYLETDSGAFSHIEGALIPFSLTPELALRKRGGNIRCSEDPADDTWLSFLETECNWIHHWVELPDAASVENFRAYLDAYAQEQRQSGRFAGPYENELHDIRSWLEDRAVVNRDYEILLGIAFLFLLVCLLNCIGLLLAKFMGKTGEVGLRRALGGSRAILFQQNLVEVALIGLLGGALGLAFSLLGLAFIESLYSDYGRLTHLNLKLVATAIALAIGSTLLAGLMPAWRACRLPVSRYLKSH